MKPQPPAPKPDENEVDDTPPADPPRKEQRNSSDLVVDQVASHEQRLQRVEGGLLDGITNLFKSSTSAPASTTQQKADDGKAAKDAPSKSVGAFLAEYADPFGIFDEDAKPATEKKPDAA